MSQTLLLGEKEMSCSSLIQAAYKLLHSMHLSPEGNIRSLSFTINDHLVYVVQFTKSKIFNQAGFALDKIWSKHLEHLWHYYRYLVGVVLTNIIITKKVTKPGYFFHLLQCWLYFLWLRGLCFCILSRFWGKISRKKAWGVLKRWYPNDHKKCAVYFTERLESESKTNIRNLSV